jgi:hypothetical protein
MLVSFTDAMSYRTQSLPHRMLATGPGSSVVALLNTPSLEALLARHREHIKDAGPPLRVTSQEDLVRQSRRFHEMSTAWREAQDPTALLTLDAEGLAGGNPDTARLIVRRLSVELPKARVL